MGTQRDSRGKGSEVGRKGVHVARGILAQFLPGLAPLHLPVDSTHLGARNLPVVLLCLHQGRAPRWAAQLQGLFREIVCVGNELGCFGMFSQIKTKNEGNDAPGLGLSALRHLNLRLQAREPPVSMVGASGVMWPMALG